MKIQNLKFFKVVYVTKFSEINFLNGASFDILLCSKCFHLNSILISILDIFGSLVANKILSLHACIKLFSECIVFCTILQNRIENIPSSNRIAGFIARWRTYSYEICQSDRMRKHTNISFFFGKTSDFDFQAMGEGIFGVMFSLILLSLKMLWNL